MKTHSVGFNVLHPLEMRRHVVAGQAQKLHSFLLEHLGILGHLGELRGAHGGEIAYMETYTMLIYDVIIDRSDRVRTDQLQTRVRENDGPAIADVVMEPDLSVGAISFKVGDCVSNG